jgi:hypothetical protein
MLPYVRGYRISHGFWGRPTNSRTLRKNTSFGLVVKQPTCFTTIASVAPPARRFGTRWQTLHRQTKLPDLNRC